eukprot:gene11701-4935_t
MESNDFLVQYILLRKDLLKAPYKFNLGAMASQTSHASVSAIVENYEDKLTQEYISKENIDNMHKVVLQVENEEDLLETEKILKEEKIIYRIWREQPENIVTAMALKPYHKSTVSKYLKKFKLFR